MSGLKCVWVAIGGFCWCTYKLSLVGVFEWFVLLDSEEELLLVHVGHGTHTRTADTGPCELKDLVLYGWCWRFAAGHAEGTVKVG